MRRRAVLASGIAALGGTAGAWPTVVCAQPQGKIVKVGLIYPGTAEPLKVRVASFARGLQAKGFVEGRNVSVLARAGDLDNARLRTMTAELVVLPVDVLVTIGRPTTEAALAITRTLPIVAMDLESDPVASGFAASLARPGGNLTGLYFDFPDFSSKWLDLLAEAVPGLARLAVFWDPSGGPAQLAALTKAADVRGLTLQVMAIGHPSDIEPAIETAAKGKAQALMALSSPIFGYNPRHLADLALKHRIPTVTWFPEFAEVGGLMAYGTDLLGLFHQLGEIVGKVLAGTPPADLPLERPDRFRLVINLKTARTLGVEIPPTLLAHADEVIE